MESDKPMPVPNFKAAQDADLLTQLQYLAMLYHSRGKTIEAQEIYRLILELKAKRFDIERAKTDAA